MAHESPAGRALNVKKTDPELSEDAPATDLHSLRAADPQLDSRAARIQETSYQAAVEQLQSDTGVPKEDLNTMRVLVTGSAGYLGLPLVKTLRALGADVIGLDVVPSQV